MHLIVREKSRDLWDEMEGGERWRVVKNREETLQNIDQSYEINLKLISIEISRGRSTILRGKIVPRGESDQESESHFSMHLSLYDFMNISRSTKNGIGFVSEDRVYFLVGKYCSYCMEREDKRGRSKVESQAIPSIPMQSSYIILFFLLALPTANTRFLDVCYFSNLKIFFILFVSQKPILPFQSLLQNMDMAKQQMHSRNSDERASSEVRLPSFYSK